MSREYFDLAIALDVIEHIDNDIGYISAIRALHVHGGKCVFTVPEYLHLWSAHDEINQCRRRCTLAELDEKLAQAGSAVEKISYYNTSIYPVVFLVVMLINVLKRDGASDLDVPGNMINFILKKMFGFEKYLFRYFNLPFGASVPAVIRK